MKQYEIFGIGALAIAGLVLARNWNPFSVSSSNNTVPENSSMAEAPKPIISDLDVRIGKLQEEVFKATQWVSQQMKPFEEAQLYAKSRIPRIAPPPNKYRTGELNEQARAAAKFRQDNDNITMQSIQAVKDWINQQNQQITLLRNQEAL